MSPLLAALPPGKYEVALCHSAGTVTEAPSGASLIASGSSHKHTLPVWVKGQAQGYALLPIALPHILRCTTTAVLSLAMILWQLRFFVVQNQNLVDRATRQRISWPASETARLLLLPVPDYIPSMNSAFCWNPGALRPSCRLLLLGP